MAVSITQLDSGSPLPFDSQQLEKDLETGNTTKSPSLADGEDKANRISTLSLSLAPNLPLSSTRSSDGPTLTLVRSISGISVQDRLKSGSPEQRVFVVEPGKEDADMCARNWHLSLKLWAT